MAETICNNMQQHGECRACSANFCTSATTRTLSMRHQISWVESKLNCTPSISENFVCKGVVERVFRCLLRGGPCSETSVTTPPPNYSSLPGPVSKHQSQPSPQGNKKKLGLP